MADKDTRLVIDDLRRGRNGMEPPWAISDHECVDNPNIDYYRCRIGHKRGGMLAVSTSFSSGGPFTGTISSLFRHVPGNDQTLAELWAMDDAATNVVGRMAGAVTFAAPTLKDAPTGNGYDWTAASVNGKLFLAYKSAVARLHCWDGSTVRRTGLAASAAPTAANSVGGGGYAAVLRYYRQRSTVQVAGVTTMRSEASPSVSFTPDGSHLNATVTQATVINEGETHWEVEASTDNVTFYRIATVAIGTTTYLDSAATTTYSSNPLSALTGVYTLQKPYKFVAGDQNRMLGLGSWTSTDKQSRLEISAVVGSSDIGDAERVDTSAINSYIDFDESDSGIPTGLAGPINGSFFVFKDRQVWLLTPTGNTSLPYRQDAISKSIGSLHHDAIVRGENKSGAPALYWMSHRGPYRWSVDDGLEYLGRGVEDYVLTGTMINLSATKSVARVVYYADKRQVWYWWATGTSNDCNVGFIFDVIGEGWSRIPTGDARANIRCAVAFSNTLGASMSLDLKPYVGQTGAVNRLWKGDTGTDDNGTPFQAYVLTKAYEPGGPGFYGQISESVLVALAANGVTVTDVVTTDFGLGTTEPSPIDLTPTGSETRVSRVIMGSGVAGNIQFVQHQLGDAAANTSAWTMDRLVQPFSRQQAVSR